MAQYPANTTSSKLLVTKQNTAGETILSATSVSLNSGAYTSWQQVTGTLSVESLITAVTVRYAGASDLAYAGPITVDIGYGGAGSETVLGQLVITGADSQYIGSSLYNWYPAGTGRFAAPLRIASGQRVAIRLKSGAGSGTITYWVLSAPYANLEGN